MGVLEHYSLVYLCQSLGNNNDKPGATMLCQGPVNLRHYTTVLFLYHLLGSSKQSLLQ